MRIRIMKNILFITMLLPCVSVSQSLNTNSIGLGVDFNINGRASSSPVSMHFNHQPGTLGFYFKFGVTLFGAIDARDNYYKNISLDEAENFYGDRRTDEAYTYLTGAVGLSIRPIDKYIFTVAPSIANVKYFYEYHDPTGILGERNKYWISAERNKNLYGVHLAGTVKTSKTLAVEVSFNTSPKLFGIALSYLIPKRKIEG